MFDEWLSRTPRRLVGAAAVTGAGIAYTLGAAPALAGQSVYCSHAYTVNHGCKIHLPGNYLVGPNYGDNESGGFGAINAYSRPGGSTATGTHYGYGLISSATDKSGWYEQVWNASSGHDDFIWGKVNYNIT